MLELVGVGRSGLGDVEHGLDEGVEGFFKGEASVELCLGDIDRG